MTHKIILDTDPGIDDAMAIFFAFQSPDIEVLGLTTVYGNVPVTMAAQNALTLCEIAGKDIPVTKGVGMPWVGPESTYAGETWTAAFWEAPSFDGRRNGNNKFWLYQYRPRLSGRSLCATW